MSQPHNPTAFPVRGFDDPHIQYSQEGMSLRDYFAGQAMAGAYGFGQFPEDIAADAYRLADAMLAEREKTP